jgi:lactosylceramide 4-alpha-galactosyltransferase
MTRGNKGICCNQLKDFCAGKNCTMSCPDSQKLSNVESYPFQNSHSGYEEKVFFLETSGSGTLNIRQACAVESLALHNGNLEIYVLFMDAQINTSVVILRNLIKKYKNIRLVSINVNEYVAGTPLEHWYHCTNWRKGPYHVSHLSDGLRFLTLQKYGGYYFDLDVIHVRPVMYYRNFFCAASDNHYLASGVIHASLNNPIMEFAVNDFVINYR